MATEFPLTTQGVRDLDNPIVPSTVNVSSTERAVSSVSGAFLAGLGLSKGGLCGVALMALGGALIYRGSTDHCAAYAAMGVNTAK
jgi:uncharacterized membrane protein